MSKKNESEKKTVAVINKNIATCLHCHADNEYNPETAKFTCVKCGWFNDLDFDELDEVPIKILPADLAEKWRGEYQFKEDLHVAYVPFTSHDLRNLGPDDKTRFLEMWEKMDLDEKDRTFLNEIKRGGPIGHSPYLTIKKREVTSYNRGQGIRISTVYIKDGILEQNASYSVTLVDEQTGMMYPLGRLELKGYPDDNPKEYQFRIPKPMNDQHSFTLQLYQ